MYVHVHKKTLRDAAGACGHFCPVCRAVTVHRVERVSTQMTVNMVPVGKKKHVQDDLTCAGCTVVYKFGPGLARPVADAGGVELSELAADTSPWTVDMLMARLEDEARMRDGAMSAAERRVLIAEPVAALEYAAERAAQQTMSKAAGFMAVLVVLGVAASPIMWYVALSSRRPGAAMVGAAAAVSVLTLGIVVMLVRRVCRDGAAARRKLLLGPLVMALGPMNPREEEVRGVLAEFRKTKVGRTVRAEELLAALGMGAGGGRAGL